MTQQEVLSDTLTRLESKLAQERKVYGWLTIILSTLDVLCGMLCIIFASTQITAVVVSIVSGTVVCSRAVQVLKANNLLKTIRVLNGLSSAYVVCRMKKGEFMKNFVKSIKNNPLTLLFAILGGAVMGFAGFKLAQLYLVMPAYAYILVGIGCAFLTILFVFILGWDNVKTAILRTAKKTLTNENYGNLVEMVGTLEAKQTEEANAKAEEQKKQVELEQAKKTVAEYENAKRLLDEQKQIQASVETAPAENVVQNNQNNG